MLSLVVYVCYNPGPMLDALDTLANLAKMLKNKAYFFHHLAVKYKNTINKTPLKHLIKM